MKSEEIDDKRILGTFISIIISIFKWLCLILFVLNIGLTIGLLIMFLMKGANMSNDLIVTMLGYLSYLNEYQILGFITRIGKVRVIMAGLGYGIASSITYGLAYNIVGRFQKIFKSIITGEMYTKENVKLLNDALPLTCIFAFAQPVIIYVIVETSHVFQLADINVSGIAFIMATYILKLTFEKGYELAEANIVYDKKLSDMKAKESEAKMAELKKELAEKKKNTAKKSTEEKTKKTTTKKSTTKKTKLSILILIIMGLLSVSVNALEQNYTNDNGITISEKQYYIFKEIGFSDESIKTMDWTTFNTYKDIESINIEQSKNLYIREIEIVDLKNEEVKTYTEEITQHEYENEIDASKGTILKAASTPSVTHETSYKKLTVNILDASTSTYKNRKIVSSTLYWKKVPKVKSNDIFAARLEGGEIFANSQYGEMIATETHFDENCGIPGTRDYTTIHKAGGATWNLKKGTISYNGLGYTSKLKEHSEVCKTDLGPIFSKATKYKATLSFMAYKGTKVFVSYQHASKDVSSMNVTKKYTFSNSGLGNVIYFSDSSIASSYDSMKGVNITL